jgi:alpha-aminoadipate carrier protein LysW
MTMITETTSTAANTAACPECDAPVSFDRPPLNGQVAICTDCSAELEVICAHPIQLELAPEVEEDWGE